MNLLCNYYLQFSGKRKWKTVHWLLWLLKMFTPTLKEKGKSAQLQVGYISDFLRYSYSGLLHFLYCK